MSSQRWLKEHFNDPFVKKAWAEGYASRAAYKLLAIQKKDQLIKPGMRIIDLGASPGGWSQVASQLVGPKGLVIAVDLLPMAAPPGVIFIQGDFNETMIFEQMVQVINAHSEQGQVDLVISDMAPNLSGQKVIDQPKSMHLAELAWDCAEKMLKPGGGFLTKVFQGPGIDELLHHIRKRCKIVKLRKPEASRARSSEVYILARDFLGYNKE